MRLRVSASWLPPEEMPRQCGHTEDANIPSNPIDDPFGGRFSVVHGEMLHEGWLCVKCIPIAGDNASRQKLFNRKKANPTSISSSPLLIRKADS